MVTKIGNLNAGLLAFIAAAPLIAGNQPAPQKPNIIFILADDMGWKDLACYGNKYTETPNIDALAKSGILFTQAYAACPVSSPTRASIMTGKYPARLQLTNFLVGNHTDPSSPVLPAPWKPYLEAREITLTDKLTDYGVDFIGRSKGKPYYSAMVESIDDGVGRIINALKREGLLENTIIVFTSDNGGLGLDELASQITKENCTGTIRISQINLGGQPELSGKAISNW